ncbi:GDP-mannose transporter, putative [Pediculus humanus corporis]|uniref:GDP-mannose transporter, putative n=1 Tax=Pediculus humanus subsp. corporis TaxID=121224 RepID=E0VMY9_PEDHC|nr:GDP-mannose transporter, putative [Pediculus humanus corporis]EEB14745.1 GDP-mannose transporter, putative [Pediculus humanus corporis]
MSLGVNKNRLTHTIFYLHFNLICSIVLVLLNRWIYVNIGFPNLTLTLLHFITTFIGLNICERFNLFQVKTVPLKDICLLSVTFCGFVIFTNLSLQFNTVGTYQLAKVVTTPVVVFLQKIFYKKDISFKIKCTLIPIIVGVVMNFYYDIKFNYIGTLCATLGVLITSSYQILVSSKQHELQMNPMQLLYYQTPVSSLMLLPIVIYFEPLTDTIFRTFNSLEVIIVCMSCIVALFVNISIYWIIGKTSPLTYNIFGHLKFCLTALGGFLIFNEPMSFMQCVGVILTLSGVTFYAHFKV